MKQCVVNHDDSATYEPPKVHPRNIAGGVAFALVGFAYVCAPYVDFAAIKHTPAPEQVELTKPVRASVFYLEPELLDPSRPVGFAPKFFRQTPPLSSAFVTRVPRNELASVQAPAPIRTVLSVPLPTPRPTDLGLAAAQQPPGILTARSKAASPFEKLFAKAENANDGTTAIYDITARTVYMPDGTKFEAHSGLGGKMDDPRHVSVRMHGATPPHVYDLTPREALFHGDEALRMYPVAGAEAIHGRTGLLTHSYLLGPNGQSNGCVSFKDYPAFVRAYKDGKVKRLVVVASIDDPQFDLRLLSRAPVVVAHQKFPTGSGTRTAFSSFASFSSFAAHQDDRFPAMSSSLASRTSSSARSLN